MKRSFYMFVGMVNAMAVQGLIEDARGLEGTITQIRGSWIDSRISVPIAILALIGSFVIPLLLELRKIRRKAQKKIQLREAYHKALRNGDPIIIRKEN